jgi:hypothetical protein
MLRRQEPITYIHLMGGLGNQLFQFAAGLYYSLNSSRQLVIDDSLGNYRKNTSGTADILSYSSQELKTISGYSRNIYLQNLTEKILSLLIRVSLKSSGKIVYAIFMQCLLVISNIFLSFRLKKTVSIICPSEIGYKYIAINSRFTYLHGYFQTFKFASDPRVKDKLTSLSVSNASITRYIELAATEKPLIIHVRLGDYLEESNFGVLSADYYEEAIRLMLSKFKFEYIWVFSDEIDRAKSLIPPEYASMCRWIDDKGDSAAETLEKMRLGTGYIIGNSSFSWWGAFLSYNNEANVIAPKPWFTGIKNPVDLLPLNWIRINR